jgi:hypothetical protein
MKHAADRKILVPSDDNVGPSWADDIKAHNATYFTAELLQRTREAESPDPVWTTDLLALERMARAMRRDHIASLVYAAQLRIASALAVARAAAGRLLAAFSEAASNRVAGWHRARLEAYLGESFDVYDLERRMRALERRHVRLLD